MFDITPYKDYIEIDSPIPYVTKKKEIVMLYPILTKDANKFINSYDILRIDKNNIEDINIIQSSYLQFLFQVVLYNDLFKKIEKPSPYYWKFIYIMELCFKLDDINKQLLIKVNDKGKFVLYIKDVLIDYKDFDNLIQLIMYQNVYGYEDESDMNTDIKQAIDEYYALTNKGKEIVSLERKMSIIGAHTGILKKDLLPMTYYSFLSLFEATVEEIDYIVNKNIEANGGKFNKPLEHFVYKNKKSKYAGAFARKEKVEQGLQKIG